MTDKQIDRTTTAKCNTNIFVPYSSLRGGKTCHKGKYVRQKDPFQPQAQNSPADIRVYSRYVKRNVVIIQILRKK